jgi:hypothetical protein
MSTVILKQVTRPNPQKLMLMMVMVVVMLLKPWGYMGFFKLFPALYL